MVKQKDWGKIINRQDQLNSEAKSERKHIPEPPAAKTAYKIETFGESQLKVNRGRRQEKPQGSSTGS